MSRKCSLVAFRCHGSFGRFVVRGVQQRFGPESTRWGVGLRRVGTSRRHRAVTFCCSPPRKARKTSPLRSTLKSLQRNGYQSESVLDTSQPFGIPLQTGSQSRPYE